MTATCTVRNAVTGACGKTAVWDNGEFAECAEHAADVGAMATATRVADDGVGAFVEVHRYGKVYQGEIVRVGRAVRVEWTYGNGKVMRCRVKDCR